MAYSQEFHHIEAFAGSDGDSSGPELVQDQASSTTRLWRVGVVLAGIAVVGVVMMSGFASKSSSKVSEASVSDAIVAYDNSWIYTGKFVPMGISTDGRTAASFTSGAAGAPPENIHDGNVCGDDEEMYGGLCYVKCSIITRGTHPIRTTAFSCCQAEDIAHCGFKNQEVNLKVCGGFDKAGNVNGQTSACPHSGGTCFEDEELYLGVCYKKCSILTNNQYDSRVSPWTCCKSNGLSSCIPGMGNTKSATSFNVGGSTGKDAVPHNPETVLTETK